MKYSKLLVGMFFVLVCTHEILHQWISLSVCERVRQSISSAEANYKGVCDRRLLYGSAITTNTGEYPTPKIFEELQLTKITKYFSLPMEVYVDSGSGIDAKPDFRILEDENGHIYKGGLHPADT